MALAALPCMAQTASFVKFDTATQGKWGGVYGSQGYSIEAGAQNPFAGLTAVATNDQVWTWATGESAARDLVSGNSTIAACWYSFSNFYFDVNAADGATHQVALYLLDYDTYGGGRVETISVTSAATGATLAAIQAKSFVQGTWAVFTFSGHVHVNVANNNPKGNAVVSGIFFDPSGSSPPPAHSVTITWTAVSGATGYNVYRNGALLTSVPAPPFKDTAVVAGGVYSYQVSSVNGAGESPLAPVTQFIIPSP